jgi:DNA replicative helicase MCM subunit Mcm2 (Cdc46/Mcm family)
MLRGTCSQRNCRGQMLTEKDTVWMDYCEGRLQQTTKTGHLPRSVTVVLDDELTEKISVGSAVEVVGLVLIRWRGLGRAAGSSLNAEQVVYALNVYREDVAATRANLDSNHGSYGAGKRGQPNEEVAESKAEMLRGVRFGNGSPAMGREAMDPRTAAFLRTLLVQSVCPQLSGTFGPRLGLLLAAIGGVAYCVDGIRVRGTTHALFVGDPGTGKSQLLKYAAAMAPRSVFAAGMTSTTAGLTVAAVKEFGEWTLEPGALVLADGGVCAIDELRTVSAADRTALHEAMEQQTISVAKAGLVTRLRTETSVIAACNPQRKTDNALEIGVGGPLLSRFDLLFFMWDDRRHDEVVAAHILQCSAKRSVRPPFSIPEIKLFVRDVNGEYLNDRNGPHLDEGAVSLISRYYAFQRRVSNDCAGSERDIRTLSGKLPVTVRFLESLVRFTLAHVKLRGGQRSSDLDAALAILLMELTAHSLKIEFRRGDAILNSFEVERVFLNENAVDEQVAWLRVVADRIGLLELPADELDMMRSQLSVQQDYSSRKRARPAEDSSDPSDPWVGDLTALNSSPSPLDGRGVGLEALSRGTGAKSASVHHPQKAGEERAVSDHRLMDVHEWNEMQTVHGGGRWPNVSTARPVPEKISSPPRPDPPRLVVADGVSGGAPDRSPPTPEGALSQGFHLSLTPVTAWEVPLAIPAPRDQERPKDPLSLPPSGTGQVESLAERIKRLKKSSG